MSSVVLSPKERDRLVTELYLKSPALPTDKSVPVWSRLVTELLRHPCLLVLSLLVLLLGAAATTLSPRLLGYLIDEGIVARSEERTRLYIMLLIGNEAVRIAAVAAQGLIVGVLGLRVMHRLRTRLLEVVLKLKVQVLDRMQAGQLVSRVTEDTNALAQLFTSQMVSIVERVLIVTGIFVSMVSLNTKLALTTAFLIPMLLGAGFAMSRRIYALTRDSRQKTGAVSAFITEALGGTKVLRMLNAQGTMFRRFRTLSEELAEAQFRPTMVNAVFHPGMTLVNGVTIALLMWMGSHMIASGELSIGVLAAFISYTLWMFWPILHIVNQWNVVVAGMASAQRIFSIYDLESEDGAQTPRVPYDVVPVPNSKDPCEVRFQGVWFSYRQDGDDAKGLADEEWVLKDVTFTVTAGSRVGLVGATGSGKSTILALLFRFYTPQRGNIFFGGKPLEEWPLHELRHRISLLQQDGSLFDGTVAENSSFFDRVSARSSEMLARVGLIDGTKHVSTLSSGERQWVLLARALGRTPQVWILDEAAAHLDPELDRELHRRVEEASSGATMIVVAHRLSSVDTLDTLIVLDHGRVVEIGSPQVLRERGGHYARMLALQGEGPGRGK